MTNKRKLLSLFFMFFLTSFVFARTAQENRDAFINQGMTYLGVPYVYGGTTRSGFDCSGFVYRTAQDVGLTSLPRASSEMYRICTVIDKSQREPGDLVFFTEGKGISHVAIYIGSNQILHCASEGSRTGVIISSLSENYWAKHFYGYGRFISATGSGDSSSNYQNDYFESPQIYARSSRSTSLISLENLDFTGFVNWNIISESKSKINLTGYTLQAEYKLNSWSINPGIFGRLVIDPYFSQIQSIPVCLSLHFTDNISAYAGLDFNTLVECSSFTEIPQYYGLSFKTNELELGSFGLSFVQDVNLTIVPDNFQPDTVIFDEVARNTVFSTGISISIN